MLSADENSAISSEVQVEPETHNGISDLRSHVEPITTNGVKESSDNIETLPQDCVFIAGGGPVGMTVATVLAFYGIKSIVLERNKTTTKWPKMDLTNVRSMEFFRKLKLADGLRERGVPSHIPYTVLISSGLGRDKPITQWNHPGVDQYRELIAKKNDGTMPLEPYQRISQEIFEAWLKELCDENPLIEVRFGWKVESIEESETGIKAAATDLDTGVTKTFLGSYAVGCDGASSKVRRSLQIPLNGGEVPGFVLLVHFKSRDLAKLHKQGRFWHIFMAREGVMGGAAISQDEVDTFTTHLFLPMDADDSKIGSEEAVYTLLGGMYEPYEIKIDEILVRSTYRPSLAVAEKYAGPNYRVLLAGDAAHQNIPTGGYGMNMGLGDAYDVGWKLASVIKGYGRKGLLVSYEQERKPVAFMNVERSGVHMAVHSKIPEILGENAKELDADTEKGRDIRNTIHEHYQTHDGENTDLGIEMGYRYKSVINTPDTTAKEPFWEPHEYTPTTWPGSRPPHVFLKDGTAIFDLYGDEYSLVEFSDEKQTERGAKFLVQAAKALEVPLKHIILTNEDHARDLWEKPLILVRPDGHVSWRGEVIKYLSIAYHIMEVAVGYHYEDLGNPAAIKTEAPLPKDERTTATSYSSETPITFTSADKMRTQHNDYKLDKMGDFQT